MACATIEEFQLNSADITASFSLDVIGGEAVNGGGELWSPYWTGPAAMTLVTLSTTDVHDLGAGSLSYRFGGGTDLIGGTTAPIDASGLVFTVNTDPDSTWVSTSGATTTAAMPALLPAILLLQVNPSSIWVRQVRWPQQARPH